MSNLKMAVYAAMALLWAFGMAVLIQLDPMAALTGV